VTRGILFDFDGTLIDTWHLYLESFRRTLEPHFNRLLSDAEILALRPIAERRLLGQVVEGSQLPDYFSSFLVHYRSIHDVFSEGLYPGVVQMLTEARRAGYLLGIVTGKAGRHGRRRLRSRHCIRSTWW
jgi:phosphoglycolate phosphatase-like HAD superfamily hydrolase